MPRRASLSSQRSSAAVVDDALFHVSQRLDALAADDEHAILYFSRVVTPPVPAADSSSSSSSNDYSSSASAAHPQSHSQPQPTSQQRHRTNTITTRRRRRRRSLLIGLSAFYFRFACLLGLGWFLAAFAVLSTAIVLPASPSAVLLHATASSRNTQRGHELAALATGSALGGLLGGSLADHFGRRRVLLLATAWWVLFQTASGFAWTHETLLAGRALSGLGLGAQLALLSIVLSEFAAQRRRGLIVVVGMAFAPLGALAAVHSASRLVKLLNWQLFTSAVLGGAGALYLLLLALFLDDSPRFLAAIGRVDAAMELVEAVEAAHGINRNARITMPSSLYEPPAQHQHHNRRSSTATVSASRQSALRQSRVGASGRQRSLRFSQTASHAPHTPPLSQSQSQLRRRRTSAALTPGMVSIRASLGKRWKRVLFCHPYALRSLGLALLWLCLALGLSLTVAAAARFGVTSRHPMSSSSLLLVPTSVSIAAFVGLLLAALLIDRCGRVPMFLFSLLVASLATTMLGMQIFMDLDGLVFLTAACSLLALAGVFAMSTASVWGLECYGVLIRATGMGLTFFASCVGAALGQWIAWSEGILSTGSVHFVLWGVAGSFIIISFVVWLVGYETRGLEDVDSVITNEMGSATTPGMPFELRDSSEKYSHPPLGVRSTYHSKDTSIQDDQETQTTDDLEDQNQTFSMAMRVPPSTSANSDTSTFIGSSISRTSSSGRHSSVRFSSQRTLSSGRASASRNSRGSSLSRQQHNSGHSHGHSSRQSMSASFRRREASLSAREASGRLPFVGALRRASSAPSTPPFVIRRSSLSRAQQQQEETLQYVRPRRTSRQREGESTRSSFGSTRLTFADLTTALPAHLDPHSVREHLGRRSSDDSSSVSTSSSTRRLGVGPEHDMLTIEIDPFDDNNFDDSNGFVTVNTPMPMLG